jgi:hypothetical protein
MNKKLILPLLIGTGVIGLYFLMKNKQPQLVSVAPPPPPAQPTTTTEATTTAVTTTTKPLTLKEIIAKYKKFTSV